MVTFQDIGGLVSLLDSPEADSSPQLEVVKGALSGVLAAFAAACDEHQFSQLERVRMMEVIAAASTAMAAGVESRGAFDAAAAAFELRLNVSPAK